MCRIKFFKVQLNKQINVSIVSRLADEMNEPKVSIDVKLLFIYS